MDGSVNSYQTTDMLGKSQLELVIKVYDGAISSMRSAHECYKEEKYQDGYEHLEKAKSFVVHLYTTLDTEKGGEIAANLSKLYTHIVCQIDVIAATKDLTILDDMISVLTNLRSGWSELRQKQDQNDHQPTEQTVSGGLSISG